MGVSGRLAFLADALVCEAGPALEQEGSHLMIWAHPVFSSRCNGKLVRGLIYTECAEFQKSFT